METELSTPLIYTRYGGKRLTHTPIYVTYLHRQKYRFIPLVSVFKILAHSVRMRYNSQLLHSPSQCTAEVLIGGCVQDSLLVRSSERDTVRIAPNAHIAAIEHDILYASNPVD